MSRSFECTLTPRRLRSFLASVQKPAGKDGCWEWVGTTSNRGYGNYFAHAAHRVAYQWMVGPVPDGLDLDHLCRNKRCVNPHHLEPVTKAENNRRSKVSGPFQLRHYCIHGHALIGADVSVKSTGKGRFRAYCLACRRKAANGSEVGTHA